MMDTQANQVPHIGDIHLRSFNSFVNNHVRWLSASHTIQRNEDISTLCIRGEPRSHLFFIARHKRNLTVTDKVNQLVVFQQKVISTCVDMISQQQDISLQGSSHIWEFSLVSLREKDPFCFEKFKYALSRVPGYIKCMDSCVLN